MGEKNDIARRVINAEIKSGRCFIFKSICNKIIEEGGILRAFVGTTITEYLERFEDRKEIIFYPKTGIFKKVEYKN